MFDFEKKPHGMLEPKPQKGAYIFREPKGDPDMLFFADHEGLLFVVKAAALLSVQGYTARVVSMENPEAFSQQPESYRKEVFPDTIPVVFGYASDKETEKRFRAYSDFVFSGEMDYEEFAKKALDEIKRNWV